ncbi:hypothetical protein [Delftia sp. HK171]|jgi:hypothetical protein|uniref:hypothetical protein n=1 Tax=Delftia sp. HK171 TaxID=1920191 RepID=UPI001154A4D1|nr:hypothetical protein [Delftia sp. HK171]TQL87404.1 hypothetical protein FB549_0126 [Delftia sp. HK171]
MLYGERLLQAMQKRSATLGRDIPRKDVAKVAGTSVQNIGMIITNAKGTDQKLRTEAHEKVAAYLKVNSRWLLTGEGEMDQVPSINAPSELTPAAVELAVLFDMIPQSDKLSRAKAFNAASTAIMQVLQDAAAKP